MEFAAGAVRFKKPVVPFMAAANAATQAKATARDSLTAAVRGLVKPIQAKPNVTDESQQAIGITVSDGTRTSVGAPTTAPVGRIEQANRLEHTINFADSTTPTSKAKPAGVRGCQVWVKIGTKPPPRAPANCTTSRPTREPRMSLSSTPPTPTKPPTTGSAGKIPKAKPDLGPQ